MTDRINVAELREWATAEHVTLGLSEKQVQVLALVEAVEATYELIYGEPDIIGDELNRDRHKKAVTTALARFDFAAGTTSE